MVVGITQEFYKRFIIKKKIRGCLKLAEFTKIILLLGHSVYRILLFAYFNIINFIFVNTYYKVENFDFIFGYFPISITNMINKP